MTAAATMVRHAFQGSGASCSFELRLSDLICVCLLDAGVADPQGRELLVKARALLSGLCAEGRRQGESSQVFLARVLGSAAHTMFEFVRERGWEDRNPVSAAILVGDTEGLWAAEAGACRVLGFAEGQVKVLLAPRTVAQRMEDDGLVASAAEAPEAFRTVPTQGLGMSPRDFDPRIRGPFNPGPGGGLVLESLAVSTLLHPSEYHGHPPDEGELWRLLRFCTSKQPQASPAILVLADGQQPQRATADDDATPIIMDGPGGLSRLPWLFGALVLLGFLALVGLGLLLLRGEGGGAGGGTHPSQSQPALETPAPNLPLKSLYKGTPKAKREDPDATSSDAESPSSETKPRRS
jgi:hypothetical protein